VLTYLRCVRRRFTAAGTPYRIPVLPTAADAALPMPTEPLTQFLANMGTAGKAAVQVVWSEMLTMPLPWR